VLTPESGEFVLAGRRRLVPVLPAFSPS
jgi:hypothetical protein